MENPTRRRLLAAGFAGTTLGLLGSRAVSATPDDTTPPADGGSQQPAATTTTAAPLRPSEEDIPRLQFAHAAELAARDLYQAALDAGAEEEVLPVMRANHQAYADVIKGILGPAGDQVADEGVFREFRADFETDDVTAVATAGHELESALVATHIELIGELTGLDGAHMLASILTVEARQATVLADVAGHGDDLDVLFADDAQPLSASTSIGG